MLSSIAVYPQNGLVQNGLVENFSKPLMKTIRITSLEGKDWRCPINDFCLATVVPRTLPLQSCYFIANPRTKIPYVSSKVDENVIDSLASAKYMRNKTKPRTTLAIRNVLDIVMLMYATMF